MSQIFKSSTSGGGGAVDSVTGTNGVTAFPTTGNVVVSGVNATTSTVGVASFNLNDFTVSVGGQVSAVAAFVYKYIGVATNYVVLNTDVLIGVTSTATTLTISLPDPTAVTVRTGQVFIVNDESIAASINNITIDVNGAGCLIDGDVSQVIDVNGESMTIYFNGTDYYIV